jgi:succinate dehydrogenase/fumarate reductase flavoprotein subunit
MWLKASLVRDADGLASASSTLEDLATDAAALCGRTPHEVARVIELRAGLDCARAIVAAAAFREESRGAHWRRDFPEPSSAWLGYTEVTWRADTPAPAMSFHPKSAQGGGP